MPGSDVPRKRADTDWPEHAGRVLTPAQRTARSRAKKKGIDPDTVAPKTSGLPTLPDGPAPGAPPPEVPEIPSDPEGASAEGVQDRSVRDAVAASLADWGKTMDPLATVALGLAKTFDASVEAGSVGAATLADRLVSVLDRLRPVSGAPAESKPGETKVTDPAQLVSARQRRLAQVAAETGA